MAEKISINNIYIGSDTQVKCCTTFYELLMTGKEVTPEMILAKIMGEDIYSFDGLNLDEDLPEDAKKYRVMQKQIMKPMIDILKKEVGDDIVRKHIGNHHYVYVYHGVDKDPLKEMRLSAVKKSIEDFRDFCIDSSGFFPKSWLDYFFRNTQELLDIKATRDKGEEYMMVSVDREIDNIYLLPILYEKIKNKTVIEFNYSHAYGTEIAHRIIHPHYLHEFNGRWHLFGYEKEGEFTPANIALDRIMGEVTDYKKKVKFVEAQPGFYKDYFKDILGVSQDLFPVAPQWDNSKPHIVHMRAYNEYIYGLTKSKKIHKSQKAIGEYDKEKGYGDFSLKVKLNNEFIGRILQMGEGLEIIYPPEFRQEFAKRVKKMAINYGLLKER